MTVIIGYGVYFHRTSVFEIIFCVTLFLTVFDVVDEAAGR